MFLSCYYADFSGILGLFVKGVHGGFFGWLGREREERGLRMRDKERRKKRESLTALVFLGTKVIF